MEEDLIKSTYNSWTAMKYRCDNPRNSVYRHYGGRGITYDQKWGNFKGFLEDMGYKPSRNHTIERIDVNYNYCKNNCTWITKQRQTLNRRNTILLELDGKIMPMVSALEILGKKDQKNQARLAWYRRENSLFNEYCIIIIDSEANVLGYKDNNGYDVLIDRSIKKPTCQSIKIKINNELLILMDVCKKYNLKYSKINWKCTLFRRINSLNRGDTIIMNNEFQPIGYEKENFSSI